VELREIQIDRCLLAVNPGEMHSLLVAPGSDVDPHTLQLVESYIPACIESMTPRGGYGNFKAVPSASKEEINIEGTRFHTGKIIRNILQGSEYYTLFAVTAGAGPEELARSLFLKGLYLEGYIVDLIGSALVDAVADQLHDQIRKKAEEMGMRITNRYSPGYCGWDVVEQQKLFGLFPEGFCGITLSPSSLMLPIKSVSGIIGLGPDVTYREYTCELCSMKDCNFRRTRKFHEAN
jgi:hypothetical protein